MRARRSRDHSRMVQRAPRLRGRDNPLVTNARFCCAPRGCWFVPVPLSTAPVPLRKTVRSSRAGIRNVPQTRRASVCGSAAGVALRLRSAMRLSPPSAPLAHSPRTPTRRPKLQDKFNQLARPIISAKAHLGSLDVASHRVPRDSTAQYSHPTPMTSRAANSARRRVRHLPRHPPELSQG